MSQIRIIILIINYSLGLVPKTHVINKFKNVSLTRKKKKLEYKFRYSYVKERTIMSFDN